MTAIEAPGAPKGATGPDADAPIVDESEASGGLAYPTRRQLRAAERAGSLAVVAAAEPPVRQRARIASAGETIRKQLSAAGAMTIVAGLFAALALPAYAGGGDAATPTAAAPVAELVQDFESSSVAALTDATRDEFGAVSGLEMRAQYYSELRAANLEAYLASGARARGDDYPWAAELSINQGGSLSPLNYFYRECVDFVAWRLNRDAGVTSGPWKWVWSNLTPGGGNAISWKYAWQQHGWDISSTPRIGWVAWFGGLNHVAYVSEVHGDGTITVEEYNWGNDHQYNQRRIPASDVTSFLSPPQ